MTGYSQADSIRCFHVNEVKKLLIGYEQNIVCDSLQRLTEQQLNEIEHQNYLLQEIIETDSIRLSQKDEIIDMADKETRKQKRQKFLYGGIGLIGIILLLLM